MLGEIFMLPKTFILSSRAIIADYHFVEFPV